jgi:hypothetical protein
MFEHWLPGLGVLADSIIQGEVYDGFKSPAKKQNYPDQIAAPGYFSEYNWSKFRHAKDISDCRKGR